MSKNRKLLYTFILFLLFSSSLSAVFSLDLSTLCTLAAPHVGLSFIIVLDKIISKEEPANTSSCSKILDALQVASTQEALDAIAAIDEQYDQDQEQKKATIYALYKSIAHALNSPTLQNYIEEIAEKDPEQFLSKEGSAAIAKTFTILIKQRKLESILMANYAHQLHEIVSHISDTAKSPTVTLEKLKQAVPQSVPQPVLLQDLSEKEYRKLTGQD